MRPARCRVRYYYGPRFGNPTTGRTTNDHPQIPGVNPDPPRLDHLDLVTVKRGGRRIIPSGGSGKRKYKDHRAHADELREQAEDVVAAQLSRPRQFDLDPKLILVVELNRDVPTDTWRAADLLELDASTHGAVVAFSSDPQLGAFLERLARHRAASPTEKGNLFAADLFDAIVRLRRYDASDRVSGRLASLTESTGSDELLTIDVELWHPGDDVEQADEWRRGVEGALETAGGLVLDRYVDHARGLMLLRARVPTRAILEVAEVDEIATLDVVPQVPSLVYEALDLSVDALPDVVAPAEDAPLVALVDSGVNPSHPLIDGVLYETTTLLPDLDDGADEHGHGTGVAGVLIHGAAEDWLTQGVLPRPSCRLLSIRVLDAANRFPETVLWETAVVDAVRYAAQEGARVVNLSIGDPETPQTRRRATPVAAVLDSLARDLNIVIVVPTGNVAPADYTTNDREGAERFVERSIEADTTCLIDPAPAALAITVGGVGQSIQLKLGEIALGDGQAPSGISRRGPGVGRGIKPELVAPSGTMAWSPTLGFVERPRQLARILCSNDPTSLFRADIGTSYASPFVARAASAVIAENPGIQKAALARALVLQSARPVALDTAVLPTGTEAEVRRHGLHVCGHGQPTLRDAIGSSTDRVVLVAEGAMPVDYVMVFEVPLPRSFLETGGVRRMTLSVCFDPLTRYRRLDYLGSRLYSYVFHGAEPDRIAATLIEADETALQSGTLGDLRKTRLDFQPSATASSDSANIVARWTRHKRMDAEKGDTAYLAIRSTRRWAPETTRDPFGVALALEHEGVDIDLHAELSARIPVPVEVSARA